MINTEYNRTYGGILLLFLVVILVGCQATPEKMGVEEGELFRRGIVTQSEQGLMFKPCYVQRTETIIDHTERLKKRLDDRNEPVVYAELSGGHIYPGKPWEATAVHLLGGNQATCYFELPENQFRAAGNKPLWIADIREDGIYVKHYAHLSNLVFPLNSNPINLGNGHSWNSQLSGYEDYALTLNILALPCRDRYGVEYEFQSEMILNGEVFRGCARQGELDKRTMPGLYSAELPGLRTRGRFISLDLTKTGEAVMSHDYRNGQPLIVKEGTWELFTTGKIVVQLMGLEKDDSELLIFERDKRGGLALKGYHAAYGQNGLRLERIGPERSHRRFNP